MTFKTSILDEPEIEFGDGGLHVDPRRGLSLYGPLQPMPGDQVRIGVIGTAETYDGVAGWMDGLKSSIPGKSTKQPNLFAPFPGLGNENPFRCRFEVSPSARRILPAKDIADLVRIRSHREAVTEAANVFYDQAQAMLEGSDRPDVIIAALPFDLICRVVNDSTAETAEDPSGTNSESEDLSIDFRDLFKAKALHLESPTQLAWPTLWDDRARIPHKLKETTRTVQDPATRTWNLLNALFYKAGRTPWRLPTPEDALDCSYVGIGFYRDLSGQRLLTSTAQMFDERGKGLILRGGRARTDKADRHPYLDREDAYDIMQRSLKAYFGQHHHYPARLVVMKTARFEDEEVGGFQAALSEAKVAYSDFVWISERSPITIYREGSYPPLRGTTVKIGRDLILFTRGSVPFYRTYPGMRVPRPLMLRPCTSDTPMTELAQEVLALTKMNWNTTQFDGALPVPIRAARQVGKVLRHIPVGQIATSRYQHYI